MILDIGLTIIDLAIIAIALILAYAVGFLLFNVYINLTVKSASQLFVLGVLMGATIMALILDAEVDVELLLIITIIWAVYVIVRGAKQKARRQKVAQQMGRVNQ